MVRCTPLITQMDLWKLWNTKQTKNMINKGEEIYKVKGNPARVGDKWEVVKWEERRMCLNNAYLRYKFSEKILY